MRDILASLFAEDNIGGSSNCDNNTEEEGGDEGGPFLCRTCYNLLEQVDAFETHLNRTRASLQERRKTKKTFPPQKKDQANVTSASVSLPPPHHLLLLSQIPARVETVLKVEPSGQ